MKSRFKNTDQKIRMQFVCDEDFNQMAKTECGRFCEVCKKEVFDFTSYSHEEIMKLKKEKGALCGYFRIEQVYKDELIPLNIFRRNIFNKYSAQLLAFGLISNPLAATDYLKKEQPVEVVALSISEDDDKKQVLKSEKTVYKGNREINLPAGTKFKQRGRTTIYRVKKFPWFVRVKTPRHRHFAGKF